jgi:DNA-directed RNA polymerase specialized sigma subunit
MNIRDIEGASIKTIINIPNAEKATVDFDLTGDKHKAVILCKDKDKNNVFYHIDFEGTLVLNGYEIKTGVLPEIKRRILDMASKGFTQNEISRDTGVSQGAISKYLSECLIQRNPI